MRLLCLLVGIVLGAVGVLVGLAAWTFRDLPSYGSSER